MEQIRIGVAFVLCILVFLFWQMFFVEKSGDTQIGDQKEVAQREAAIDADVELEREEALQQIETDAEAVFGNEEKDVIRVPEIVSVETPLYTVRITEKGAAVQSVKLNDYRESASKTSEAKEMIDPENGTGTILLDFKNKNVSGLSDAVFVHQSEKKKIRVGETPEKVVFRWESKGGIVIEKAYLFSAETYLIDIEVTVENRSATSLTDSMTLSMIDALPKDATRLGFTGPSAMVDGQVEELKIKKLSDKNRLGGNITWSAFQDRYFMSTLIPSQADSLSVTYTLKEESFLESRIVLPEDSIPVNTKKTYNFQAYFGPKNITLLKQMGHQLERVVDFGWFDWLARPCLWIMNLIYRFVPNYGVAIILLTILIKAVLWPLGNKSYKSMSQMKKMQPLMAEIRERYKDDKQKMNVELMGLYKTYKVNPLGGCLPMLVQIPVLFALYRMLYQAVELRHEPFIGWIQDLSAPERMFNFGFSIPFMQDPAGIPVLTILMGVTMYIQQKMQPPMGDPAQAKMMMFMPVFLIVICMNLSSGLVLYWFISNILSILQQYYVNKKTT
jgi:YidC/Oxa1 family membrane protein insertase